MNEHVSMDVIVPVLIEYDHIRVWYGLLPCKQNILITLTQIRSDL